MATDSIDLILKAANVAREQTAPAGSSSLQDQAENYSEDGQEEQDTDFEEEIDMSGDDESDSGCTTHTTHNGIHGENVACNEQGGARGSKSRAAASEIVSRSTDSRRRKKRSTNGDTETKRRAAITLHNVKERQRRQDLKQAVLRLRNQLRRKTKKPSTISVLRAAQQEITELKSIETAQGEELDAQKKKHSFLTWRLEKLISDYKSGQQSGALARPMSAISIPGGCPSPYFLPHGGMHAPLMLPPHHHSTSLEEAAAIPPANVPAYGPVPNLTPLINVNAPLAPPHVFPFSPTHNHMMPLPSCSPHSPFLTMMRSPPTHHVASPFVLPSFPNFGGIGHTGARFLYPTAHSFTLPHSSNYPIVPGTLLNPPPSHGPRAFQSNPPLPLSMHHRQENSHDAALDTSNQPRWNFRENPQYGHSEATEQHQNEHVHYVHNSKNGVGPLNDHNFNWTKDRNLEPGHVHVGDNSEEEEELVVDDDVKSPEDSSSYPSGGCNDSDTEDVDTQTDQLNSTDLSYNDTKALTKQSNSSSHPSVITQCPKNFSVAPALIERAGANPGVALVSKLIEGVRPQISQDVAEGVLAEKREALTILNSKTRSVYTSREEWYSSETVHKMKGKNNGLKNSLAHCAVNVRTSATIVCS